MVDKGSAQWKGDDTYDDAWFIFIRWQLTVWFDHDNGDIEDDDDDIGDDNDNLQFARLRRWTPCNWRRPPPLAGPSPPSPLTQNKDETQICLKIIFKILTALSHLTHGQFHGKLLIFSAHP